MTLTFLREVFSYPSPLFVSDLILSLSISTAKDSSFPRRGLARDFGLGCLPIKDSYLLSLVRNFCFAFVLLVSASSMSDSDDPFDLTPRAAARSTSGNVLFSTPGAATNVTSSEGFEGGFGSGLEEYGKSDMSMPDTAEEMDVSDDDGRDSLFHMTSFFGESVCGGVISSGQGIRRCCTLPVVEVGATCGVVSHAMKADVPLNSFCVKIKVKGGKGAPTAKCIRECDMMD